MKLLGNGIVATMDASGTVLEDGCVAYDDSGIAAVGTTQELKRQYPNAAFTDVQGRVIMPGFINTHMHIYSAMARGMNLPGAPVSHNFVEILENLWWRIDKKLTLEDVTYSAYTTYIDCVRNGVTTIFDHHASFGDGAILSSLSSIAQAAGEVGIRTSLCFEVSDRDGGEKSKQSIQENIRFIEWAQKQNSPLLDAMFGIHASFTVSDDTLRECVEAESSLKCGFHAHTAEAAADVEACIAQHGKRVVERFYDFGVLGEKSLAVHCVHINEKEMQLLLETGTPVVHNPESNMGNAVGCSPVVGMMDKGIPVGLGTDGYTADMLESLKVAAIIHKHVAGDPAAIGGQPCTMLFDNNQTIAGRHFPQRLGVLEKGAAADLIVMDYNPPTPLSSGNLGGHVVFGMSGGRVDTTIVAGKTLMENRRLVTVDEKSIYEKSRELTAKLWNRM